MFFFKLNSEMRLVTLLYVSEMTLVRLPVLSLYLLLLTSTFKWLYDLVRIREFYIYRLSQVIQYILQWYNIQCLRPKYYLS
jgi:hypothetical protein